MLIVGSTGGEITALTFDGCDAEDDDECEAAKGSTVVGQMTFKVVRPNPTRFFGLNPTLDPKFGLSRVRLALRVKKRVQLGRVGLK